MKLAIAGLSLLSIALGALWLSAASDGDRLVTLMEQAHERGIHTAKQPRPIPEDAAALVQQIASTPPWHMIPELREILPHTEDINEMSLIVRHTYDHQRIAERFAALAPFHACDDPQVATVIPALSDLLAVRARLEIAGGRWDDAFRTAQVMRSIGIVTACSAPTGSVVRTQYHQVIERLAAEAENQPERLRALLADVELWKPKNLRQELLAMPAVYIEDIDEVATGNTASPATYLGPFAFSFERLPVKVTRRKIELLEAAIEIYDHWDDSPGRIALDPAEGDHEWSPRELFIGYASFLKRAESSALSSYRAARLTVACWLHRGDSQWPTAQQLDELGFEATDPLSGERFEIRTTNGLPRVYGVPKGHRKEVDSELAILDVYF